MKRILLFCLLLPAACDSPTDGGAPAIALEGRWSYAATQVNPALNIEGQIEISEQNGRTFSGTIAFIETDVHGVQRPVAGVLNGRVVGDDVADIDVYVDLTVRRHVGRIAADSVNGTWSITGTPLSGSFTARRLP